MIKNANVICFDIDDCILPHHNGLPKQHRLQIFKLNIERLVYLQESTNSKLFVTSSWGMIWKIIDGELCFRDEFDWVSDFEEEITHMLNESLKGKIVGLTNGERLEDIDVLLKANNRVVAFDDMDLSSINHKNYLYCYTCTMITDKHLRDVNKFLN